MEYLFYDLEFATQSNNQYKICEFGYVITNEKFEILERDNFIINPNIEEYEWDFNVLSTILTKAKIVYENGYLFDECYDDIKDIFEEVDMVFGHSTYNDAKGLNDEIQRYNLLPINHTYYDVNELYKKYKGVENSVSVSNIIKELELNGEDSVHDAGTDAFNTMLILKELCRRTDSEPSSLIEACPDAKDDTNNFVIGSMEQRHLKLEQELLNNITGDDTNIMMNHNVNQIRFFQFLDNVKITKRGSNKFKNMIVAFSLEYEKEHYSQMLNLVQMIVNEGGEYTHDAKEANLFVSYNTFDEFGNLVVCSRYKYMLSRDVSKVSIITFIELLNRLEITEDELNELPRVSFDFLFADNAYIRSFTDRETINRIKLKKLYVLS